MTEAAVVIGDEGVSSGLRAAGQSLQRPPVSMEPQALDRTFRFLVAQWKQDTEQLSSIEDMVLHPAYLKIIGLGPQVLRLLFQEIKERPDHWFTALQAITGLDPVRMEDRGKMSRMTEAWVQLGSELSYL